MTGLIRAIRGIRVPGPSDDSSNSCKTRSYAAVSITAISSSTADYEQTGFVGRHENDLDNMTPSLTTSWLIPSSARSSGMFMQYRNRTPLQMILKPERCISLGRYPKRCIDILGPEAR